MNSIRREIMGNFVNLELTDEEIRKIFDAELEKRTRNELTSVLEDNKYEAIEDIPESLIADMIRKFNEDDDNEAKWRGVIEYFSEELAEFKEKWKVFTKKVTMTVEKEYTIKARNEEEADKLFEAWSEKHSSEMVDDLTEDAEYNGEYDYDDAEESDEYGDPDYSDIVEGRNV